MQILIRGSRADRGDKICEQPLRCRPFWEQAQRGPGFERAQQVVHRKIDFGDVRPGAIMPGCDGKTDVARRRCPLHSIGCEDGADIVPTAQKDYVGVAADRRPDGRLAVVRNPVARAWREPAAISCLGQRELAGRHIGDVWQPGRLAVPVADQEIMELPRIFQAGDGDRRTSLDEGALQKLSITLEKLERMPNNFRQSSASVFRVRIALPGARGRDQFHAVMDPCAGTSDRQK